MFEHVNAGSAVRVAKPQEMGEQSANRSSLVRPASRQSIQGRFVRSRAKEERKVSSVAIEQIGLPMAFPEPVIEQEQSPLAQPKSATRVRPCRQECQWRLEMAYEAPPEKRAEVEQRVKNIAGLDPYELHAKLMYQFQLDVNNWDHLDPETREDWREWVAEPLAAELNVSPTPKTLERLRALATCANVSEGRNNRREIRRQMQHLIESDGCPVPFSFAMCCLVEGANPHVLKQQILERIGWPGSE